MKNTKNSNVQAKRLADIATSLDTTAPEQPQPVDSQANSRFASAPLLGRDENPYTKICAEFGAKVWKSL